MFFVKEEDKKAYLLFLKSLLKGKVYAEFMYMIGILSISKHISGSELNMFLKYDIILTDKAAQQVKLPYKNSSSTSPKRFFMIK